MSYLEGHPVNYRSFVEWASPANGLCLQMFWANKDAFNQCYFWCTAWNIPANRRLGMLTCDAMTTPLWWCLCSHRWLFRCPSRNLPSVLRENTYGLVHLLQALTVNVDLISLAVSQWCFVCLFVVIYSAAYPSELSLCWPLLMNSHRGQQDL